MEQKHKLAALTSAVKAACEEFCEGGVQVQTTWKKKYK